MTKATITSRYPDFQGSGAEVMVTISGPNEESVEKAAKEAKERLSISLSDDRLDMMKLGVRGLLLMLFMENKQLAENLRAVQEKSGKLLDVARDFRKRLMALGEPDPGCP